MAVADAFESLRQAIRDAKGARNRAMTENATAADRGRPAPHSDADLQALRLAVDLAALEARRAGCPIDDLVGPSVGSLDQP